VKPDDVFVHPPSTQSGRSKVKMDRRQFLKDTSALAAAGLLRPSLAVDAKPLNFLFILIDDMGWADSNCYGNEVYRTPNIDKLAASGMRFTDAYAAAPVCSPTRASILTGKYPARLHMTAHIPAVMYHRHPENAKWLPAESIWQLPLEETTFAEPLNEAGYATGYFGKWHVAGPQKAPGDPDQGIGRPEFYPEHQGFDLNVGGNALGAPPSYFDPYGISALENRKEGEYLPDRKKRLILSRRTKTTRFWFISPITPSTPRCKPSRNWRRSTKR
jgi:arylsulfatase A-like enzyme